MKLGSAVVVVKVMASLSTSVAGIVNTGEPVV